MNKLVRDTRRLAVGGFTVAACFSGLAILHQIRLHLGLEEHELYAQYPSSWYAAVALGLGFIASLIFTVKKAYDTHPHVQLRSKPDEFIERVLSDPQYAAWHKEAKRHLTPRRGTCHIVVRAGSSGDAPALARAVIVSAIRR